MRVIMHFVLGSEELGFEEGDIDISGILRDPLPYLEKWAAKVMKPDGYVPVSFTQYNPLDRDVVEIRATVRLMEPFERKLYLLEIAKDLRDALLDHHTGLFTTRPYATTYKRDEDLIKLFDKISAFQ